MAFSEEEVAREPERSGHKKRRTLHRVSVQRPSVVIACYSHRQSYLDCRSELASGSSATEVSSAETAPAESASASASESTSEEGAAQERTAVTAPVVRRIVVIYPALPAERMAALAAAVDDFFRTDTVDIRYGADRQLP